MRVLLYYPGCSIRRDFIELEQTSMAVLKALGFDIHEIDSWYCCGGFPGLLKEEHFKYVASLRTLSYAYTQARKLNTDRVLVLCPFCYNTLKHASTLLTQNIEVYTRVSNYLKDEFEVYRNGLKVVHLVEVLHEMLNDVSKLAVNKLNNINIAVYYGCKLLRPRRIAIDNPDNPKIIEHIVEALGGKPVDYPYKTFCCGSFHTLGEPAIVERNTNRIAQHIKATNAVITVTPCPLCLYNLRKYTDLKVLHLSELVAYAMNLEEALSPSALRVFEEVKQLRMF